MPIYIQYGDIKGDVTAEGHLGSDGWVEINGFSFGVGRGIASPTGGATNRESSAPHVGEITMSKAMDVSSVSWLEEALWGEGKDVTIDLCKTNQGALEVFAQYKLYDCMVSGYSVNGSERPSESLSLNFAKFEYTFTQGLEDGSEGESSRTGYDIGKATAV